MRRKKSKTIVVVITRQVESNWKPIGISITHQSGTFLWCRSQGEANESPPAGNWQQRLELRRCSWSCCLISVVSWLWNENDELASTRLDTDWVDSFLKNEIFIGRLSFRYISRIVINFIDNCHILMAWLCAWLSDCYCFVWFAFYVRGICTAKIYFIFVFLCRSFCPTLPTCRVPPSMHAPVNCFRRKLLHEHNLRGWLTGWQSGDINMGNMQRGHQYVFGMGIFPQILLAIYRSAALQLHATWLSCKKLILSWRHFYEEIKSATCKLDSRLSISSPVDLFRMYFPLKNTILDQCP